ncbi:MAG: hypothetical protein IKU34_09785 [Clostridia bacterium]|nr:hypothetical protein [Clostridia bacterium]
MKAKLIRLWQLYSNMLKPKKGSKDSDLFHIWWNEPLSVSLIELFRRLKRRIMPDVHLPAAPKLSPRHRRLRIVLTLAISALVYGLLNGWSDTAMMFVSLTVEGNHPGSKEAGLFFLFTSLFVTAVIHTILYRLLFGEGEDSLTSADGVLFFLMDVFLLNVVDGGVMSLSMLVNRLPAMGQLVCRCIACLLAIVFFGVITDHLMAVWITIGAGYIMNLLGNVTFYLCLPAILVVQFVGLSAWMPLEFFFNLCILLIGMGISMVLERLGVLRFIRRLCLNLSKAKVFFLIPYALLPFAVVYGFLTGKL